MQKLPSPPAETARYQIACLMSAVLSLLLLAACRTAPVDLESTDVAVPPLPDAPIYRIDSTASRIHVLVFRAGPLARFGHNHVLVAPLRGVIHAGESAKDSGFRIEVDADAFVVDPPDTRALYGEDFATEISAEARKATRNNMLGEAVLDADRYPRIVIESITLSGSLWNPLVRARITLRDAERVVEFPATVFQGSDGITVIANFTVSQSTFGIEPFSILGGGLSVRDELDVRVRVVADAHARR